MGKENFILLTDSFCAFSLEDAPIPLCLYILFVLGYILV